jgi:hypothetical protein
MIRNLSGIYFRSKVNGKWDNVCFEDLPLEEQDKIIDSYTNDQKKQLIKLLADTIKKIGDDLDITTGKGDSDND